MTSDLFLIAGLGNPGAQYLLNRHNIGFMAVDALAEALGAGKPTTKFSGEIRQATLGKTKLLLLKPQTYMNLSGESVQPALSFYKLSPDRLIVIHDELDLPAGEVRHKKGGGTAGHNGLKSLDQHVGNGYHRIRIGIGHPGMKGMVSSHVLSNFTAEDLDTWVPDVLSQMQDYVEKIVTQS